MTQTRTVLLIAWLIVAFFLWDAWQRDYLQPPAAIEAPATASGTDAVGDAAVPAIPADVPTAATPGVSAVPDAAAETPANARVVLANDVLRLTLDARGGTILAAELLDYPQTTDAGSPPVQLMSQDPTHFFVAQSGWVGTRAAPSHQAAFRAEHGDTTLADTADSVELPFVWTDPSGITVRRTYRLSRTSYVVDVQDDVVNAGGDAWRGTPYHQLLRVPPPSKGGGFTNPESYSFVGAAWYSPQDKFEKFKFADYDDAARPKQVTDGWIAMLQHYFAAVWIPPQGQTVEFSTAVLGGTQYLVRARGATVDVAPGASASQTTRLYVGPKLPEVLDATAPGLGLTLDYGIFTIIAQPLHWLLAQLHKLTGNWGWAIVLLVVLIKLALFKLSEAQYRSFANMRRVQPRIEALKERYGDDRQKFQMAMMELYKKEKINPMGGCLPILPQIPIFMGLYWVLLESVELRHAPWFGWIQNLTAPDPYFILPVLNMATMYLTQRLTPMVGMDPIQKKMMTIMPLVMSAMFVFFPAGLVLYWTTNGALGLLQQWIIIRRNTPPASPAAPAKA